MKKSLLICLSVSILLIAFTSCSNFWMYKSVNADLVNAVKQKTTIQTFEHLNEPIVIALPVYEYSYLFGDKNNTYKSERAGDIIAVIDIETDSVYDWIFFPGDHGWSIWRLVEAGVNPTRYLMSSVGTKSIATLDPQKTTLAVTQTGITDNFWNYKAYGTKVALCYVIADERFEIMDYHIRLFDSSTNKLSDKDLFIETPSPGFINELKSSPDGNLWISYDHSDGKAYIREIDTKSEELREPFVSFEINNTRSKSFTGDGEAYNIEYVSDEFVFVGCYPYGIALYGTWIYVVNRKTGEKTEIQVAGYDCQQYVKDVQKVNDSYYAVVPNELGEKIPTGVNIYKIDIVNKSAEKEYFLPFDMTENTYVRGNKIYFMNSRNPSDITYTYYDTVTKQQGDVVRISAEQIMNEYMGK